MEAAKNAVNNLLNRGGDDTTNTTTGNTSQSGNPTTTSTTGTGYGTESTLGTQETYTRDDEYNERYGATGKGAGSGATAQVDSGSTTTGTALGGRASGNTAESAARATGGGSEDADGYGTEQAVISSEPYNSRTGVGSARPSGTEPTAYHQVTGNPEGAMSTQFGIGKTSTGINQAASGQKLTDGAADYRDTPGGISGVGAGVGSGYAASRDTTGLSTETYPQTSTSDTSGIPGVAAGDTYPRSGDLSSHTRTDTTTSTGERKDSAVITESRKGLTGTGEDGSHSAVFGLTPDGHTYDDTSHHSGGNIKPAHSSSVSDTEDRRNLTGTDSVAGQMNDLKVNERGDGKDPTYSTGSDTKPGAGFQAGSPDQSL